MQTALWKGRATIYISVAITELFKINRRFVFVFYTFLTYRGRVCFVFVENSTDYNFPLCTCLISSSFYFTSAESIVEMLHAWRYCFKINLADCCVWFTVSELLEFSVQNFLCSERRRCFMSIARLNNQLNNIFLAKFPNWRGFCGGNHWTLFLQPTWKYEQRMVYLSKLSIKTSMFRALYFRWRQWNGMFPIETTFVAHDNNEVLTVKLGHETSLVAYSTDKRSNYN